LCAAEQVREAAEPADSPAALLRAILLELRRARTPHDAGGLTLRRLMAYLLQVAAVVTALLATVMDDKALLLLAAVFLELLVLAVLAWERKP
jgi:hypothetical protein